MLLDEGARWLAGPHIGVVWPSGAAVIDGAVPMPVAERIWTRMRREPQLGTFLKTLAEASGSGFLDLPPFAVVVIDGGRCHAAVRGEGAVEAVSDAGGERVTGAGITTWAEKVLIAPRGLRLVMASGDEPGAPLIDGVVRAGALVLGEPVRPDAAAPAPAPAAVVPAVPAPVPEPAPVESVPAPEPEPQPEQVEPEPVASVPEPASLPEPAEPAPAEPAPAVVPGAAETWADPGESVLADDAAARPAPPVPPAPPKPPAPPAPPEGNPYRSLWDASIAIDIEAAAVRDEAEAEASAVEGRSAQLDGETVADEGMVDVDIPVRGAGAQILARFCDRGHPNPPERTVCFACQSPVGGDARLAERPQLGWVRVDGGETVPLRGPVLAGRNPSSTALRLAESPRLIALPYAHVSGTHVAFLLEGWRVMVQDLRSSNGTYLRRHGKPPVRLPEVPYPLVPGDLIDLGKGLFIHLDRIP